MATPGPDQDPTFHQVITALNHAHHNQHDKILLLSDDVIPHREMLREMYQHQARLKPEWSMLFLGAVDERTPAHKRPLDPKFYQQTNPDITGDPSNHWTKSGAKEKRVGCRCIYMPDYPVQGLLALGLNKDAQHYLRKRLPTNKSAEHHQEVLDKAQIEFVESLYAVCPNLFIRPMNDLPKRLSTAQIRTRYGERQWNPVLYDFDQYYHDDLEGEHLPDW
jgi:hypothetical protein